MSEMGEILHYSPIRTLFDWLRGQGGGGFQQHWEKVEVTGDAACCQEWKGSVPADEITNGRNKNESSRYWLYVIWNWFIRFNYIVLM
jgi:hypothetical protein